MKIQLDLTRGKIVRVDNTTSYDFADIEKLEDGFWYYRPESGGCSRRGSCGPSPTYSMRQTWSGKNNSIKPSEDE